MTAKKPRTLTQKSAKWIAGKKVDHVDMRPFEDGRGKFAHDPYIFFEDGSYLYFNVRETEVGTYGFDVLYMPPDESKRIVKKK